MSTSTNKVISWLKEFQDTWLPQNIPNNTHLVKLIKKKLHELEQVLNQENNQNRIIIEDEYEYTENIVQPLSERPLIPDNHIDHENAYRPAIRLKRIPLNDAERYLPPAWQTSTKSKRGRKKNKKKLTKTNSNQKRPQRTKVLLSSTHDETTNNVNVVRKSPRTKKPIQYLSTSSLASTQSLNADTKKGKRKLRAIDAEDDDLFTLGNLSQTENTNQILDCDQIPRYIGQNGILSQTRKTNQTTIDNDDFTIKLQSRQFNPEKTLPTKSSKQSNAMNFNTLINDEIPIDDDVSPMDDEQILQDVMANNDNESLFTSLDIPCDKTLETNSNINYNYCIEDISNDAIDPPLSSSTPPNLSQFTLTT